METKWLVWSTRTREFQTCVDQMHVFEQFLNTKWAKHIQKTLVFIIVKGFCLFVTPEKINTAVQESAAWPAVVLPEFDAGPCSADDAGWLHQNCPACQFTWLHVHRSWCEPKIDQRFFFSSLSGSTGPKPVFCKEYMYMHWIKIKDAIFVLHL